MSEVKLFFCILAQSQFLSELSDGQVQNPNTDTGTTVSVQTSGDRSSIT